MAAMSPDYAPQVTVVIPILHRHHRVRPVAESCIAGTGPGIEILFVVTPGDDTVIEQIEDVGADYPHAMSQYLSVPWPADGKGDYARKINAALRVTDRPWLFMGADDLEFEGGWLTEALRAGQDYELRSGMPAGVIGTNDLGPIRVQRGEHSTHSLVSREWARGVGVAGRRQRQLQILCEEYWHEYVDDELVAWARFHEAFVPALASRVRHRHPNWDASVPNDPMYSQQRLRMQYGRRVFKRREHLWS